LIHISNFRKVKRILDVIQTFSLIQQGVKSKLLHVGDGPEMQTAIDCVKKYDIEDKVLFLGKQKNISDLLSISDLKLLMSEKESFGLVLLEAMACEDRKSTRLNSSHVSISYAVFCLKKKNY